MHNRPNIICGSAKMAVVWMVLVAAAGPLYAQSARDLSQVNKVFVSPIHGTIGADALYQSLIKQLRKSAKFEVVETPSLADAIINPSGQIWVKGYVATNTRSPEANPQTIYAGYLSVEVVGAGQTVLWSYLVEFRRQSFGKPCQGDGSRTR